MERRFRRDYCALEEIFGFVSEFLTADGIDAANEFALDLIIEELFTNFVKYNADGKLPISIALNGDGEHVAIEITDYQVAGFDVTRAPAPDIHRLMNEGRAGGLGLHLVKRMADDVSYSHVGGNSIIRVMLRLER